MRILVVAGRHAVPVFEPTTAACHVVTCPVPNRGAGPGLRRAGMMTLRFRRARDRAVPPHGRQIRIGPKVGYPARPDAPVAPVGLAAIDRVPFPVRVQ